MPLEYYYKGHLRWSFFWENPNYTAAFLACLLAWLWWMGSVCRDKAGKRRVFMAAFCALCAVELGAWFLLAKTYSRGGLVAAIAGMAFFFVCLARQGRGDAKFRAKQGDCVDVMPRAPVSPRGSGNIKMIFINIASRLAIAGIICAAVGFSSRMSPGYIAQDDSVLNRLELWKGAMVMMHDSPFHGWGRGLGGMAYVNWYQPLEASTRPVGFVNSYFEVAVEYGAHILFVALACALALVFLAMKQRARGGLALAGGSALVAWFTANLLTSLWADYTLWILPGIAASCVVAGVVRAKIAWRSALAIATGVSLVICGLLVFAGGMMSKTRDFCAEPLRQSDAVLVTRRASKDAGQPLCEVWVDGAVFGSFWGRPLRAVLGGATGFRLLVYAPWALGEIRLDENPQVSIYSGFQAGNMHRGRGPARKIIILHPSGFPPAAGRARLENAPRQSSGGFGVSGKNDSPPAATPNAISESETIVCLPAVDASLNGLPWRVWGANHAARLLYSPQGGALIKPSTNLPFWNDLFSNE